MPKKLKIFTKADCPKCPAAKQLGGELKKEGKINVEFFNVDEADGLAEAQFYSVLATPSLILCRDDEDQEEIKSWRGECPDKESILNNID